jgi:F-type H+-transporting ATPase subunit b
MELVTPQFGLVIWMTITFSLLVFILGKFAWKPIMKSIREREDSISSALQSAEEAKAMMAQMKTDNEAMKQQARVERDDILKEAKLMREQMISEAKKNAEMEGQKLLNRAQEDIIKSKNEAMKELTSYVAGITIELTQKILEKELTNKDEQHRLIQSHLQDIGKTQSASNN